MLFWFSIFKVIFSLSVESKCLSMWVVSYFTIFFINKFILLCLVYYLSFSLLPPQNPKITSKNIMSPNFWNRIFCLICTESCYDNPLAMIKFTPFQHLTRWILSLQNFTQNSVLNANGLHCHVLAKVFLIYNHFQMVDINSTNLKLFLNMTIYGRKI